jgi:two-component system, NtrC family, sensor histidine kinase KinB
MKPSIRTKFTIGIVFFFVIISVLSIFSSVYLNRLSEKTASILKENHLSVVYAREMSDRLIKINQEITDCFILNKSVDSLLLYRELNLFDQSLQSEKNNITEPGEDKLVDGIDKNIFEYRNSMEEFIKHPKTAEGVISLQKEFGDLFQQLMLLSEINEKAIEFKTEAAKESAKNAWIQMTFLATLCFLIALSFTYSFASYFNERFSQLYKGIKEIASSNYGQRLYFKGKDEFYEISLVFNEMAEKLTANKQKMALTLDVGLEKDQVVNDLKELKQFLLRIKRIEEQATELIAKIESKK